MKLYKILYGLGATSVGAAVAYPQTQGFIWLTWITIAIIGRIDNWD